MKSAQSKSSAGKNRTRRTGVQLREAPYPGFIEFCHPTLREKAPAGREWLHEIKIDGYRAQVHIHAGKVTVYSRSGYDWTQQFVAIARAAEELRADDAIIDGEATVLGKTGLPDFQALRRELCNRDSKRLIYHAFDLLYLNGRDLRPLPLIERKAALRELLAKAPDALPESLSTMVSWLQRTKKRIVRKPARPASYLSLQSSASIHESRAVVVRSPPPYVYPMNRVLRKFSSACEKDGNLREGRLYRNDL
jgi:ATP-dependent DNA ligase